MNKTLFYIPLFIFILLSASLFAQNNDYQIIDKIIISGNKKTKTPIILRELLFAQNDTLLLHQKDSILTKSKENLLNCSLFNFVKITDSTTKPNHCTINISVKERWYLWPALFFEIEERNFNVWLQNADFARANYGFFIAKHNMRGKNETLKMVFKSGHSHHYGLSYNIPYINKSQTIGLYFSIEKLSKHEIIYKTENNRPIYFKDNDQYAIEQLIANLEFKYRYQIHKTHALHFKFNHNTVSNTIAKYLNPQYFNPTETLAKYFSLYYEFKNDHRNYKSYPTKGYYIDFKVNNTGFGIFGKHTLQNMYFITNLRKFWHLKNKIYFASGLKAKISTNKPIPYYLTQGLGYGSDIVRGFDLAVIDGQHYGLLKNNLKFELLPTRIKTFNFIPFSKFKTVHYAFYINAFFDTGYVIDNQFDSWNNDNNTLLYGYGLGLDFVTYYDKVLRIEYAFNKFAHSGWYIHFVAPI